MSIRHRQYYPEWYNYQWRGCYHITLTANERGAKVFGELQGESVETAYIKLNPLGKAVEQCIKEIPSFHPHENIQIEAVQVMPDHAHFVMHVLTDLHTVKFGSIIGGVKTGINKARRRMSDRSAVVCQAKGEDRSAVGCQAGGEDRNAVNGQAECQTGRIEEHDHWYVREQLRGTGVMAQGFYMRTLLRGENMQTMVRYVLDNPRRAWLKTHNRGLFQIKRKFEVSGLLFTAMGNSFLLDFPSTQVIECSRSCSQQQVDALREKAIENAQNGVVTYSGAMSDGERQITRAIREIGAPLVIFLKDGFPLPGSEHEKYYKPGGVYFDACAAGQLLLLEPCAETYELPQICQATEAALRVKAEAKHWAYRSIPHTSSRYHYMAINSMVKILSEATRCTNE